MLGAAWKPAAHDNELGASPKFTDAAHVEDETADRTCMPMKIMPIEGILTKLFHKKRCATHKLFLSKWDMNAPTQKYTTAVKSAASTSWKGILTSSNDSAYALGGKNLLSRCLKITLRPKNTATTSLAPCLIRHIELLLVRT